MSVLKSIVAIASAVWLVPGSRSAQQGTGELRGRVVDAQGAVLPGVAVVAKNEASGQYPRDRQRRATARSS